MLLLLNLLISVLGDTYDQFSMEKDIIDYKEKAELVYEVEQIKYFFVSARVTENYLQVCDKHVEETEISWEGKMLYIKKIIDKAFHKLNTKTDEIQADIDNKVKKTLEEKMNALDISLRLHSQRIEHKIEHFPGINHDSQKTTSKTSEILKPIEEEAEETEENEENEEKFDKRSKSLNFPNEYFETIIRNTFPGFQVDIGKTNDKITYNHDEIKSKIENVEGKIGNKIETQMSISNKNLVTEMEDVKVKLKNNFSGIEAFIKEKFRGMSDVLERNTKKIEEGIKAKIELKFSSIEGSIKNKINERMDAVESEMKDTIYQSINSFDSVIKNTIESTIEEFQNRFDSKLRTIDNQFDALNTKLDRIISNP